MAGMKGVWGCSEVYALDASTHLPTLTIHACTSMHKYLKASYPSGSRPHTLVSLSILSNHKTCGPAALQHVWRCVAMCTCAAVCEALSQVHAM